MRTTYALMMLMTTACGSSGSSPEPPRPTPDYVYDGIGIKVESDVDAPYMNAPEFPAEVIDYVTRAAEYGGSSLEAMQTMDLIVVFTRNETPCGPDGEIWDGCAHPNGVIYVHAMANLCYSVLAHEVLHEALQDWDSLHSDPRWLTYKDDLRVQLDVYCSSGP